MVSSRVGAKIRARGYWGLGVKISVQYMLQEDLEHRTVGNTLVHLLPLTIIGTSTTSRHTHRTILADPDHDS